MRLAERFLVLFALLGTGMVLAGVRDGAMMVTVSFFPLAAFYAFVGPFVLLQGNNKSVWWIGGAILSGCLLAYCCLSVMACLLRQIRVSDMAINCGILLGITGIAAWWQWRKNQKIFFKNLLQRVLPLLVTIMLVAILELIIYG